MQLFFIPVPTARMRFANADDKGVKTRLEGWPLSGHPSDKRHAAINPDRRRHRLTQLFRDPPLPPLAEPPAPPVPSPALLTWSPNRSMFKRFTPMPPRPAPPLPPSPALPPRPPFSPPVRSSDITVRAGSSSTCCPSISTKLSASDIKS